MIEQQTETIAIKGIRDGLLVTLPIGIPIDELLPLLTDEINRKASFLRNSRIALEVGHHPLDFDNLTELQALFGKNGMILWAVLSERETTRSATRDLGLATRLPGSQMDLAGNGRPEPAPMTKAKRASLPANALLMHETIRSGRYIYHEGHIVVVGDVNPGAELVAEGNIIVWGKLRGLVHAGAAGDHSATISALDLSPTQLRIAEFITVTPPADSKRKPVPETASIKDNQIVAEAWASTRF